MAMNVWDQGRLANVSSILSRYAEHLAPGHVIRLGMEGDPCAPYRSSGESPSATVLTVNRIDNGEVRFRAQVTGTDTIVELDNVSVSPQALWEIHPDYIETYRGDVNASLDDSIAGSEQDDTVYQALQDEAVQDDTVQDEAVQEDTVYQALQDEAVQGETGSQANSQEEGAQESTLRQNEDRLLRMEEHMESRMKSIEDRLDTIRDAIVAMSGNIINVHSGDAETELPFLWGLVDRHEQATVKMRIHKFRGGHGATPSSQERFSVYQREKFEFKGSPVDADSQVTVDH